MLITVRQAVSDASMEIGITQVPVGQALGSSDQDIVQLTALLNLVADEVLMDQPYVDTLGDGYWCYDAATGTRKNRPTSDTDIILFDGRLAIHGLKYRFLKAKGLEFGEEMRDFSTWQNKLAARANKRVLDLDTEPSAIQ